MPQAKRDRAWMCPTTFTSGKKPAESMQPDVRAFHGPALGLRIGFPGHHSPLSMQRPCRSRAGAAGWQSPPAVRPPSTIWLRLTPHLPRSAELGSPDTPTKRIYSA